MLTDHRRHRIRTATYWTCTAIMAWEMVAGSMWDLLRIEYTRSVLTHLGCPHYLLLLTPNEIYLEHLAR